MRRGFPTRAEVRSLTTERLLLRAPCAQDAAAVARLADNPRVALQTARMPYPYRLSDAEAWIARAAAAAQEVTFLIVCGRTGEILGAAGYGVPEEGDAEIGYWIGEPYWGRGYATEATQAVIDHAFTLSALSRLAARCRVGNSASRRVLEKCGFQYQGSGMIYARALKGTVPTDDFCLERRVWQSLKSWGRRA